MFIGVLRIDLMARPHARARGVWFDSRRSTLVSGFAKIPVSFMGMRMGLATAQNTERFFHHEEGCKSNENA